MSIRSVFSKTKIALILLVGACLFFATTPMKAYAMVPASDYSCGVTLNSGGVEYLPDDISGCDDGAPAVTVIGFTTLDLRDHKISCTDVDSDTKLPIGALLIGQGATILNGSIEGCSVGISLGDAASMESEGSHLVQDLKITSATGNGISVYTNNNSIRNVAIKSAGSDGYSVMEGANNNGFTHSIVEDAGDDGVQLLGNSNRVMYSDVTNATNVGVEVNGKYNQVEHSGIFDNNTGILFKGEHLKASFNSVKSNALNGIQLTATTEYNTISRNYVQSNSIDGIHLDSGAEDNSIKDNIALNNTTNDIDDDSNNCNANMFENNYFNTAVPSCIQ